MLFGCMVVGRSLKYACHITDNNMIDDRFINHYRLYLRSYYIIRCHMSKN